MKKLQVPRSVRREGRKMVIRRVMLLCLYLLIAYIIAEYIYEGLKTTNFGNLSTTIFAIMIVPFWASGVPFKIIDRDWYGEIIKLEIKNNDPAKIDNHSEAAVTQTALVKSADGKLYEMKIYDEGEYFGGERDRVYHVGDKVLHVRWTEYLMPIRHREGDRPTACVVCGFKAPPMAEVCRNCNCSLDIRLTDREVKK